MREPGFYWVNRCGEWIVAEWGHSSLWFVPGFDGYLNDFDFDSIDEKRLTHE